MNCNRTDCFNLSGDEAARSRVAQMVRFRLGIPKRAEVEVHSHLCEGNNVTEVRVTGGNAGSIQFNIPLQAEAVTEDDVDAACEAFLGGEGSSLPGIYPQADAAWRLVGDFCRIIDCIQRLSCMRTGRLSGRCRPLRSSFGHSRLREGILKGLYEGLFFSFFGVSGKDLF